jgi:hypothetical protein
MSTSRRIALIRLLGSVWKYPSRATEGAAGKYMEKGNDAFRLARFCGSNLMTWRL